jgi:formylglycine-generating enzyme required for sulfatase activity
VENVSWEECQSFCLRLREWDGQRYRLPTEAEWEYACRAGTTTPFHFGATLSTDQANFDGHFVYDRGQQGIYRKKTVAVGRFTSNAFGLHDMHGNVWEWCQDTYAPYPDEEVVDPLAEVASEEDLVIRGGSWFRAPWLSRSAFRDHRSPTTRDDAVGLRVCYSEK